MGITNDVFNTVQYEAGVEFLHHYIGPNDPFIQCILETAEFWAWWSNQFEQDAQVYLDLDTDPTEARWRLWHTPERVVATPWKKALEAGYELMVTEVIGKEVLNG